MNLEEQNDLLVDSLLWELVGKETPPDLRERILEQAEAEAKTVAMQPARPMATLPRPQLASARPSKAPLVLALAALVTVLGVVGALWQSQQAASAALPTLAAISGEVSLAEGRLSRGERLEVGSGGKATLIYEDGTVVGVTGRTTLQVGEGSRWSGQKVLEVRAGKVAAEVVPQPKGSEMIFQSQYAEARVLGTKFTFENEGGQARLCVTEGSVRFVPQAEGEDLVVASGYFAEAGELGFREGTLAELEQKGVVAFTLMNAETDEPMRSKPLRDGEVVVLSSLSTRQLNVRADLQGEGEMSVRFLVKRTDGTATGIPSAAANLQEHPPFFVAGDHWAEGRPNDCRAWTPEKGGYQISAEAFDGAGNPVGQPLSLTLNFK